LFDFVLQTTATVLIILRGNIPDWISMTLANALMLAGAWLSYMGLLRFAGKKSSQIPNYVLLGVFLAVHSYVVHVRPNLAARDVSLSLGLLILCFQCVWLILRRVERNMRRMMREVGLVFGVFCLVSLVRIAVVLISPPASNDFFQSGLYDTLMLVANQILLILLAFALTLMVNRRLLAEIRTQEEKYAKAFRSSPYAITLTRARDGQILEVNEGFTRITGYTCAEAAGKTTIDLNLWVREEDRAAVVDELLQSGRIVEREHQFRKKSGERLIGLFSAETITIDDQSWVLSSISDITERKQAEEKIASLAKFPDENPNPVLRAAQDGTVLYANAGSQSLLEFWGVQVRQKMPVEWQQLVSDALMQNKVQMAQVTCNGQTFSFTLAPIVSAGYVNLYGLDITERKQAEEKLVQTLERLNLATRAARLGIWDWYIEKNELVWDERMYELYGIRKEDFGGAYEAWLNGLHPDDRAMSDEISRQAQRGEREYDTEFRVIWPDGSVHHLKAEGQFVRSADGTPLRMTGVNYDITRCKQAEEALSAYSEKLEQMVAERTRALEVAHEQLLHQERLAVLGQLSGSIAHELRAPLGTIKNAVYLLNMIPETSDPQTRETLDILARQVKISEQIINNLLDFARTRQSQKQPVDLNQALNQALSGLNVPDGVCVRQDLADLPPISVDPGQLGQILGNLMLNAIQAMPGGGQLTLRTYLSQPDRVAIAIADTGVGIPPENRGRLFEPLFTTKPKGIGLGLALVKMLVEAHDGDIHVESTIGQGSTFTVELPIYR
jgi:PAS domain S-box-containing protein